MYSAVLDSAAGTAFLAAFEDGRKLFQGSAPMRGREAARLPVWVESELDVHGLELASVARWTVGAGPGSFTGLRLAAALVAGWCFGRPRSCRAVPGVLGLAAAAGVAPGETLGCVYDGRNHEVILGRVSADADGKLGVAEDFSILAAAAAEKFLSENPGMRLAAFAPELPAIRKLVPEERAVTAVEAPELAALEFDGTAFDDDVSRLVYIRPAVYAEGR